MTKKLYTEFVFLIALGATTSLSLPPFNYLIVKKMKGSLILRIEDTDQTRLVKGSEKHIEDSLKWAGIKCDESPKKGGAYGPYKQSERKKIYSKYIEILIKKGAAYYAFDTKEELAKTKANY